ncbi:MAG TPA: hypothetical protein VHB47_10645 [Thermoanaerobaculia bacterium]|jgi:hypothetical protein|nr:hypothetical protein [Thermoanaerobaculia bacterium]
MLSVRHSIALTCAAPFAVALLLAGSIAPVLGQVSARHATPAAPFSFDRSAESIRRGFLGNDFMAVFNAYLLKARGEYETTEQYEKRVALLRGGDYAFRFKPEAIKYDADKHAFAVTIHTDPTYRGGVVESMSDTELALVVGDKDLPQGHYIGSNAMGAKIRVDKDTETQFSITIPGSFATTNAKFLVPVDPEVAQKVKPTLGLLYVCHVASHSPDVASTAVVHISPAIDHPLERTLIFHYLSAENVEVWAYSKTTGRVLVKTGVDSGGVGAAAAARRFSESASFSHAPSPAEAWDACTKAIVAATTEAIGFPAYKPVLLIKSTTNGAVNHFDFKASISVLGGSFQEWTCSIDYENGVAKAPIATRIDAPQ